MSNKKDVAKTVVFIALATFLIGVVTPITTFQLLTNADASSGENGCVKPGPSKGAENSGGKCFDADNKVVPPPHPNKP